MKKSKRDEIVLLIMKKRDDQEKIWDDSEKSINDFFLLICEEMGEVATAINRGHHSNYIALELIDVAATAIAALEKIIDLD